jgi:hypothetical protein
MIDKWKAWVGLTLAVIALASAGLTGARWLIAQEAAAVAKKQVEPLEQQVKVQNQRLDDIVMLNRQSEDREALIFCLDRQHKEMTSEERQRQCDKESAERWERWAEQDRKQEDPDG